MDDKTVQRKLDQIARIANELTEEARRRYGEEGHLFFEAEGAFHLMDGDSDDGISARIKCVRFTSKGFCRMGGGAW